MALTELAFYNSILGSLILVIGTFFSILILNSYRQNKSKQTLALAIMVFGSCSGWLTGLINFLLYFSGKSFLNDANYVYITFIFLTLVFPSIVYASVSIIKPSQLKIWMGISIVLMLVMYFQVFVLLPLHSINITDITTIANSKIDNFPENSFNGYALIYVILSIVAGLTFGVLLIRFGLLSDYQLVKARGILIGTGLVIFSFFAIIDSIFSTDLLNGDASFIVLIISRIFVIFGVIITYFGVTTPSFIRSLFKIPEKTEIE